MFAISYGKNGHPAASDEMPKVMLRGIIPRKHQAAITPKRKRNEYDIADVETCLEFTAVYNCKRPKVSLLCAKKPLQLSIPAGGSEPKRRDDTVLNKYPSTLSAPPVLAFTSLRLPGLSGAYANPSYPGPSSVHAPGLRSAVLVKPESVLPYDALNSLNNEMAFIIDASCGTKQILINGTYNSIYAKTEHGMWIYYLHDDRVESDTIYDYMALENNGKLPVMEDHIRAYKFCRNGGFKLDTTSHENQCVCFTCVKDAGCFAECFIKCFDLKESYSHPVCYVAGIIIEAGKSLKQQLNLVQDVPLPFMHGVYKEAIARSSNEHCFTEMKKVRPSFIKLTERYKPKIRNALNSNKDRSGILYMSRVLIMCGVSEKASPYPYMFFDERLIPYFQYLISLQAIARSLEL